MDELLLAVIAVLALLVLILWWLRQRAIKLAAAARKQLEAELESIERISAEFEPLRQYQQIPDAQHAAQEIVAKAEAEAVALTAELRANKSEAAAKAQESLDAAITESRRILESANARAKEIAGDALKAKENAERYANAARAMKNVVEGYGDEYIVPNHSVIDDLAEEFSHKDAGVELKSARQHSKSLVKNGIAADCDYVDDSRRRTAIRFVLDAFNGKVDSALSRVKHDNLGKLRQEILDAFDLVNSNGQAFRNARIEPDYREARLGELNWAVAVSELKLQEREEQRRIKEAIREEERARREIEKAQKAAEKEAQVLQKAMTEARKHLEAAGAEERAKFEAELQALQQKLAEAEAKNERAISMAQQTRRGHVYVISNVGSFGEDVFKIGLTRRLEPLDRVKELGDASVPFEFDVHAMIFSEDAPALETSLHKRFAGTQVNRVNPRKEFFRVPLSQIRAAVEGADSVEDVHWTMIAEARQFRESLAIEAQSAARPSEAAQTEPEVPAIDFEADQADSASS